MKKIVYAVMLLIMSAIVSCSVDDSGLNGRNSFIGAWEFDDCQFLFEGEEITVPCLDTIVKLDTTKVPPRLDTTIVEYPVITWLAEDGLWYSLNVGSVYFDSDGCCYNYDIWRWSYDDAADKICVEWLVKDEDDVRFDMAVYDGLLCVDDSVQVLGYYIHNEVNAGLHCPSLDSLYGYDGNSHTLAFNMKLRKMTKK